MMRSLLKKSAWLILFLIALLGLPLIGILLSGKPVKNYLEFPPVTQYVEHAPFSTAVFLTLALLIVIVITPFISHVLLHQQKGSGNLDKRSPFPWWGWAGLVLGIVAWIFAWTRFKWFAPCQHYTFTFHWIAYILVVNALLYYRKGSCMLCSRPRFFLLLFPLSAFFWWIFEYLNRFVQNWYYTAFADLSPLQYFFCATLPFSTVLPAVLGTYELLSSFPRLSSGLDNFFCINWQKLRWLIWCLALFAIFSLASIGIWPDILFPALWLAPLVILTLFQLLTGQQTMFAPISKGNWRRIYLLALSALLCGFFWEMWNIHSLAKWIYTIPFVNRFHIFEMPILGYAGYFAFGLECGIVADLLENYLSRDR